MTTNENAQPMAKATFTSRSSNADQGASRMKSVQITARIAAVLYLVIAVAAGIAHGYVPATLLVAGDAATTAHNIAASEGLLRMGGIGSEVLVLLCEIVVTVLLYVLLKPVNKTLSLLAAVARLAMTIIHGLNLLNYFFVLQLLGGASYLAVFSADQLQALALLFLNAHHYGFALGIAFFTLHVFVLGTLIFQSGLFPKVLGVLFIVAALGYLIDSVGQLLIANYGATPAFIAIPIVIAEIAFPLWLLIKGVNTAQWEKLALTTD
jgi:Domain of unknown function (DUF4386)